MSRVYHPDVLIGHDAVSGIEWDRHRREGLTVGACPKCRTSMLQPGEPYEIGRRVWYPATCRSKTCDYETTGAGPRPPKVQKGAA
ncbi:hypothetical protein GCM10010168_86070 [Actinoplanes ianthinogenes]|uniref:DNA topoisomerase type IA zn finger domain-containing protein n=1 Tax=Actinoplanes ianthinogenes TaxID=122358 RepID=A0ABN6CK30_9ACTN|nr:hypothetical protein [Actinoplanes ianthinogenes]BCJ45338.1 hypothetical protein Aiant_59950 [Actinoplanes ianthinogenes]GGR53875.1 hypothetical protein GCM10010168_86070 [Actinoplanes ianthinogenes]